MAVTTEDGVASVKSRVVYTSWGCVDIKPSSSGGKSAGAGQKQHGLILGETKRALGGRAQNSCAARTRRCLQLQQNSWQRLMPVNVCCVASSSLPRSAFLPGNWAFRQPQPYSKPLNEQLLAAVKNCAQLINRRPVRPAPVH
jgi:hypothetical protein